MNANTDANDDGPAYETTTDDLSTGDRITIAYDSPQSETPVEKTGEVVKVWNTGYELVADEDDEDRRVKVVENNRQSDYRGRFRVTSKLRAGEDSIHEWVHGAELGFLERAEEVEGDTDDEPADEPVTVRESEEVEGYELPDAPDEEATDDDVREAIPDGGVSAEDMESVDSEEFTLGEALHAIVQPLDAAKPPVDLRGTVVDTADEDSGSLTIDTGNARYKFTTSHVYQLPDDEDENSFGQSFEELKGGDYTLFRDSSTTSTDGGTVPSCSECDYEGDDVELSTVTEEVEEVVSSRYDSRDPRYDPDTEPRLEGYEVPLCPTCRGEEVEEVSA